MWWSRLRADDAAEQLVVVEELEDLLQLLAGKAGPVDVQRQLDDRVREDGRRPFDGVDLGQQRRVDQLRLREQLVVGPVGVLRCEQVADVVVLEREERVQHRQADPPVVGEAGEVQPVSGSTGSRPVGRCCILPPMPVRSFAAVAASQP